jgi:hypothetical protein
MPDTVGEAAQCVDGRAIEPLHVMQSCGSDRG